MKKLLAIILAIFFVLSLAACGKDDSGSPDSATTAYSDDGTNDAAENQPSENKIDDNTWSAFYEAYSDGYETAQGKMSDALNVESLQMISLSAGLLNFSMGEINLAMTASFLSGNEASVKAAFTFFVDSGADVDYDEKGDTATLTYLSADGNNTSYVLTYDKRSGTATLDFSDGNTTNTTTLCVQDDYVAKTYYDSASTSYLEAVAYTDGTTYFSWTTQADKLETSLYKNADAAKDDTFGRSGENYISLVDGVLDGSSLSSEEDPFAAWMS